MSEESLIFSVNGLTVRGFHHNMDDWVPVKGQRLPCALCSGPIKVFKADEPVGTVPKEAPRKFKEWLRNNGTIEVVVTEIPRKHRGKKGYEVPVVYVFRSNLSIRMRNIKREIKTGISKLQKRKKSLEMEDGDVTEKMIFTNTSKSQFEFSIAGMTMRGFHKYKEIWYPEKGDRILCTLSEDKSVEILKDGETIGNVQTEGQALFRTFINANGVIHAVVDADPKPHKTKGEEIPVIYEFSAKEWTNRLKNIRNQIENDIEKRRKKKKSLKFICGNEDSGNEVESSSEVLIHVRKNGTRLNNKNQNQSESTEDGAGEKIQDRNHSNEQVKKTLKRRSDERAGGSEEKKRKKENIHSVKNKQMPTTKHLLGTGNGLTTPQIIQPKRKKLSQSLASGNQGRNSRKNIEKNGYKKVPHTSAATSTHLPNGKNQSIEEKIPLTDKDLGKLAQCINKNWELLGPELGLTQTQIWQIQTDNSRSVELQIYMMLVKWSQIKADDMDDACLQYFKKAMAECPKVGFEQPELDNAMLKITEDYKAKKQKLN